MRLMGLTLLGWLWAANAVGQVLVDTTVINPSSEVNLGPTLSFSKVEYQNEDDNTFTVKSKTLGLGIVYNLDPGVNLLMQLGYSFDNEIEDSDLDDGTGYMVGIGANFAFLRSRKATILGYAILNYIADHYKVKRTSIDMKVTDIHIGSTVLFKATPVLGLFVGIDLVPYSDGSLDYKQGEIDIERDEVFNLKLGLQFALARAVITPEITLGGEETISLKATFAL